MLLVIFGWVIFYYTDLGDVLEHLMAMFGVARGGGRLLLTDEKLLAAVRIYSWLPVPAFILTFPILPALKKLFGPGRPAEAAANTGCAVLLALSVLFLIGQSYNPFIYFRF
jgi:alginate O-acetyltransferase complex protein AlgI